MSTERPATAAAVPARSALRLQSRASSAARLAATDSRRVRAWGIAAAAASASGTAAPTGALSDDGASRGAADEAEASGPGSAEAAAAAAAAATAGARATLASAGSAATLPRSRATSLASVLPASPSMRSISSAGLLMPRSRRSSLLSRVTSSSMSLSDDEAEADGADEAADAAEPPMSDAAETSLSQASLVAPLHEPSLSQASLATAASARSSPERADGSPSRGYARLKSLMRRGRVTEGRRAPGQRRALHSMLSKSSRHASTYDDEADSGLPDAHHREPSRFACYSAAPQGPPDNRLFLHGLALGITINVFGSMVAALCLSYRTDSAKHGSTVGIGLQMFLFGLGLLLHGAVIDAECVYCYPSLQIGWGIVLLVGGVTGLLLGGIGEAKYRRTFRRGARVAAVEPP